MLLSGALWNRRKESDGYVVILRKARRSRQTPNASLYQSRQRAHRRAPRRPNNGPYGGWREGLHRHNAGNAYRRCPSCGSCIGFALTPSPSATKLEPGDAGISARRGQAMRPSHKSAAQPLRSTQSSRQPRGQVHQGSVIELCFGGHRDHGDHRWGVAHNGRSDRNYWLRDHLRRIRLDGYHRRNHWRRGHHGSLAGVG